MRLLLGRISETAVVYDATPDAHWLPGAALGRLRIELVLRTAAGQGARVASGGAEMTAAIIALARCHRSSLPRAGRYLQVRGQTYRIETVTEERDGYVPYLTLTLRQRQ